MKIIPKFPVLALAAAAVLGGSAPTAMAADDPGLVSEGKKIFRFDTFGDEQLWTDKLGLHKVVEKKVDPTTALKVGLKVDAEALPPGILEKVDLKDPATTVALLKMNAVVGPQGRSGREQPHHSARRHLRAVPFDRRRFRAEGHRQTPGWLAEPRPERRRDHRALARAHRGAEEGVHLLGAGQVRPALQPGRQEHAAGHSARVWPRARQERDVHGRRARSPTGMRTSP